jgi:hypothetical protein
MLIAMTEGSVRISGMTEAEPKQNWRRFHLSTAVTMTLVAGGLIWANTRGEYAGVAAGSEEKTEVIRTSLALYACKSRVLKQGWPWIACESKYVVSTTKFVDLKTYTDDPDNPRYQRETWRKSWRISALFADLLSCIALTILAMVACEYFIRRLSAGHNDGRRRS